MPIMSNVLGLIKDRMFQNSAEDNAVRAVGLQRLMDELFDACNFGVRGKSVWGRGIHVVTMKRYWGMGCTKNCTCSYHD